MKVTTRNDLYWSRVRMISTGNAQIAIQNFAVDGKCASM